MKIFLQYPWRFKDSPYYKYLIEYPPKEIEYVNVKKEKPDVIISKRKFTFVNKLKKVIRQTLTELHLSIPNVHLTTTNQEYDLIHCAHCLSLNKKPWVADFEGIWQFWIGKQTKLSINTVRRILMRKYCKKIMPWTNTVKEQILKFFPEKEIKEKIEVVYPAVPFKKRVKRKPKERINLIFSARYFYQKGGLHALEVINELTRKYENVYGIFVSSIPDRIQKKYSKNKKISFYPLIPQQELFKLYEKSHILIYPGYSDSFGFAFLEAMSFGIPIVTVNKESREEIIKDSKTGFIIPYSNVYDLKRESLNKKEKEIIQKMIQKTRRLIESERLLKKMAKNCIEEIKNGQFSIKKRNKKLKKIYEEALG